MKNNVPWDVAWSLDDEHRTAYAIHFMEMGGAVKFNFSTWEFDEVKP